MGVKEVTAFTGFGPPQQPGIQKDSLGSQEGFEHWSLSVPEAGVCQVLPDVHLHEYFLPLFDGAFGMEG